MGTGLSYLETGKAMLTATQTLMLGVALIILFLIIGFIVGYLVGVGALSIVSVISFCVTSAILITIFYFWSLKQL